MLCIYNRQSYGHNTIEEPTVCRSNCHCAGTTYTPLIYVISFQKTSLTFLTEWTSLSVITFDKQWMRAFLWSSIPTRNTLPKDKTITREKVWSFCTHFKKFALQNYIWINLGNIIWWYHASLTMTENNPSFTLIKWKAVCQGLTFECERIVKSYGKLAPYTWHIKSSVYHTQEIPPTLKCSLFRKQLVCNRKQLVGNSMKSIQKHIFAIRHACASYVHVRSGSKLFIQPLLILESIMQKTLVSWRTTFSFPLIWILLHLRHIETM